MPPDLQEEVKVELELEVKDPLKVLDKIRFENLTDKVNKTLSIYVCRFGEQFGYDCDVWDQGIYGGIAGQSRCEHDWSIWRWVLRELSYLKW
ncbi:hypothetical protein SO802_021144 [Lithocarpus litseifolius]|uniref:Uncharacterized protein n=1 Tax=Lithocarpus litseifolius TaxID=425828 RepID=A0AAW2CEL0_9ROSI